MVFSVRFLLSVLVSAALITHPAAAGPTSHALEVSPDGSIFFVDAEAGRLWRYLDGELSLVSNLDGVPAGDHLQNLVLTLSGELYLGIKKSTWRIHPDGRIEKAKPPSDLKSLFSGRPADLGQDGSIYVSRDYKNIDRSLPGGDAHPVLVTDHIRRIHSLAVTPYGRVFFGNSSEVAKLNADGTVEILIEMEGDAVLGLAALGESRFLMLRRDKSEGIRLEHVDASGVPELLVSADQVK